MFGKSDTQAIEKAVTETTKSILNRVLSDVDTSLGKLKQVVDLGSEVFRLKSEVETLTIEKARKQEEFNRRERELEHKVGLEKTRQEFELAAGKREAVLAVREENLESDKKRFADQMAFHEKRFTEEVTYLKEMVGQVLERLPNIEVTAGASVRTK